MNKYIKIITLNKNGDKLKISNNIRKFLIVLFFLLAVPTLVYADSNPISDFLNSFVGAVIGLLLFFIVGPYLIYKAEFQFRAQHFAAAKPADASAPANGANVYLYGKAALSKTNTCAMLPKTQCLYYNYTKQKLTVTEKVVCGMEADGQNVKKISSAGSRNNEQCWNAEVSEWETVDSARSAPEFKIGANTITPNDSTAYEGELTKKENSFNKGGEQYKETVRYIQASDDSILAVGKAENGVMGSGDPFVVSTKNFEATKALIAQEQKTWVMVLKILGFLAFLIGMNLILGPIPALIKVGGWIPVLGGVFNALSGIVGTAIFIASLIVAIVMTIALIVIFRILRAITDNVLVIVAIAIIIGIVVMFAIGGFIKPPL